MGVCNVSSFDKNKQGGDCSLNKLVFGAETITVRMSWMNTCVVDSLVAVPAVGFRMDREFNAVTSARDQPVHVVMYVTVASIVRP